MGTELFQESLRRCAAPGDFVGVPRHRPAPQDASCGGGSLGRILCSLVGDWEMEGATHGLGLCFGGCLAMEGSRANPALQKAG